MIYIHVHRTFVLNICCANVSRTKEKRSSVKWQDFRMVWGNNDLSLGINNVPSFILHKLALKPWTIYLVVSSEYLFKWKAGVKLLYSRPGVPSIAAQKKRVLNYGACNHDQSPFSQSFIATHSPVSDMHAPMVAIYYLNNCT